MRAALDNGNAYAFAARDFVLSFPEGAQSSVVEVYTIALRMAWIISAAITGATGIFTLFEVDIPLRASLRSEFGIKEPKREAKSEA